MFCEAYCRQQSTPCQRQYETPGVPQARPFTHRHGCGNPIMNGRYLNMYPSEIEE